MEYVGKALTTAQPEASISARSHTTYAERVCMQRGYVVNNYESNISKVVHLRSRKIRSKALLQIDMYLQ